MVIREITLLVLVYLPNVVYGAETCWEKRGGNFRKHYNGTINWTKSRKVCQRWDSQTPHSHSRNEDRMFPDDASVYNASNYCRDAYGNGDIFCYTTDPDVAAESCIVANCPDPFHYNLVTTDEDFLKCRNISENDECDFELFCRHSSYKVVRSQLAREHCKELFCCERRGCRDGESQEYDGQWSTTYNGHTCRYWGGYLKTPPEPDHFPEQSLVNASNYCRDPDLRGNTWCYTDKRGFRGVFLAYSCSIPMCDKYVIPQDYDHTCYDITDTDRAMNGNSEDKAICESVAGRVYLSENDNTYPGCTNCSCCQMKGCYQGDSRNYKGNWGITANGLKCKSWSDTCIGKDDSLFPDDTVADAKNYCRHTSIFDDRGLWCYTDDPNIPEDNCDIPQCDPLPTDPPTTTSEPPQPTTTTPVTSLGTSTINITSVQKWQTAESSAMSSIRRRFSEAIISIILAYNGRGILTYF